MSQELVAVVAILAADPVEAVAVVTPVVEQVAAM